MNRPLQLEVYQDNQASGRIMRTGRAPALRHIKRTHSVSVAWIHERVQSTDVNLNECIYDVMAADMFANRFINKDKWEAECSLIGVMYKSSL